MVIQCSTCGSPLDRQPWQLRRAKRHFCNRECHAKATDRATAQDLESYRCPRCEHDLPPDAFTWETLTHGKRQGKRRRRGYCQDCTKEARKDYYAENRPSSREKHDAWRRRCLAEGGDKALRWYFQRHLGAYRKRTREQGLPTCDLDADWLVCLFHEQKGRCYYSGEEMRWNNYGAGKGGTQLDSMSIDRKDPEGGYVKGNVVLCTYLVNTVKTRLTEEELYAMCERILTVRAQRV